MLVKSTGSKIYKIANPAPISTGGVILDERGIRTNQTNYPWILDPPLLWYIMKQHYTSFLSMSVNTKMKSEFR